MSKALKDGLSNAFSSLSPVNRVEFLDENESLTLRPITPTFLMPFFDIWQNQTFTGAKVHKTPFTQALSGRMANTALGMDYVNPLLQDFTDTLFRYR